MLTAEKFKTTVYLEKATDTKLRVLAAQHRKGISELVQAALDHCLNDHQFISEMSQKKPPKP